MSNAEDSRKAYLDASVATGHDVNKEVLFLISQHEETETDDPFTMHLHGNKRSENNEMYRKKIDDKDVDVLCLTLKSNTYITGIDIGYNVISDEGGVILGKLLQDTVALQIMILSYNDIGVPGCIAIAKGLQVNDTLKVLKLDGNKLGRIGGLAIADALQVNTTLQELNLNNTEQDSQSLIAFSTVLKGNLSIKVLDITRPLIKSVQEETTVHYSRMLEVNQTIREIHLSKHGIQNFGVEQLMGHMVNNFSLMHLDLSCNKISRDGILKITRFLETNPPLRILNLACNRAEDDGAISLSESLAIKNMSLETLVMVSNSLTAKGLCALANCLRSNLSLKQLYIWGNKLETEACQAFMDLTSGEFPRLLPENTDVRAYVVDEVPYLARVACSY